MSRDDSDTRTQILEATWKLLEEHSGQGVRMSDIAKQVGISRQAVYLHFATRTELLSATTDYVDSVKGLNQRLAAYQTASIGTEKLEACIKIWGNYIPEIYGIAKALISIQDTDEAAKAAWYGCMSGLRSYCHEIVVTLKEEGKLSSQWTAKNAEEIFWTIISVENWEQLTIQCGWSNKKYIDKITCLLKQTLLE